LTEIAWPTKEKNLGTQEKKISFRRPMFVFVGRQQKQNNADQLIS
jgi:hypothetical protein